MTAAPLLQCPQTSDTGAYRIEWSGPEGVDYMLLEEGPDGSTLLYQGPEQASTVSGRGEGSYAYEVIALDANGGAWSQPCVVEVQPPSVMFALSMFAIGFAITVATAFVIIRGHRAHRRGELG